MSHNGYKNYETWSIGFVGILQQQETQLIWQQAAKLAWEVAEPTEVLSRSESARFALADSLKDNFQEAAESQMDKLAGHFQQLLWSTFERVDWDEIADHLLTNAVGEEYEARKVTA